MPVSRGPALAPELAPGLNLGPVLGQRQELRFEVLVTADLEPELVLAREPRPVLASGLAPGPELVLSHELRLVLASGLAPSLELALAAGPGPELWLEPELGSGPELELEPGPGCLGGSRPCSPLGVHGSGRRRDVDARHGDARGPVRDGAVVHDGNRHAPENSCGMPSGRALRPIQPR